MSTKPPIVLTLCGSTRFESDFKNWAERLTLAGYAIFSLDVFDSQKGGKKDWAGDDAQSMLEATYFAKILNSDGIVVLNRDRYVGESVRREIAFARIYNKTVYAIEPLLGATDAAILLKKGEHDEHR